MDTTSPQGELLFAVFRALAQYERALIRERVMAGLQAAATRGRRGGRPRAISPETLAAIRDALAGGMSKAAAGPAPSASNAPPSSRRSGGQAE